MKQEIVNILDVITEMQARPVVDHVQEVVEINSLRRSSHYITNDRIAKIHQKICIINDILKGAVQKDIFELDKKTGKLKAKRQKDGSRIRKGKGLTSELLKAQNELLKTVKLIPIKQQLILLKLELSQQKRLLDNLKKHSKELEILRVKAIQKSYSRQFQYPYNNNNIETEACLELLKQSIIAINDKILLTRKEVLRYKNLKSIKINKLIMLLEAEEVPAEANVLKLFMLQLKKVKVIAGIRSDYLNTMTILKKQLPKETAMLDFSSYNDLDSTIFSGFDGYIMYLLKYRKNYNYKGFVDTYKISINDLRNQVNLHLLDPSGYPYKTAIKALQEHGLTSLDITDACHNNLDFSLLAEDIRDVETDKNIIRNLVSNSLRTCLQKYCLSVSSMVSVKSSDIKREVKQAELNKINKIKQTSTAGKLEAYLNNRNNKNNQKNAIKTRQETIRIPFDITEYPLLRLHYVKKMSYRNIQLRMANKISLNCLKSLIEKQLNKAIKNTAIIDFENINVLEVRSIITTLQNGNNKENYFKSIMKQLDNDCLFLQENKQKQGLKVGFKFNFSKYPLLTMRYKQKMSVFAISKRIKKHRNTINFRLIAEETKAKEEARNLIRKNYKEDYTSFYYRNLIN